MISDILPRITNNDKYNIITDSPYEYKGRKIPRVTEIISKCIHEDSLVYWANSLGFKRKNYEDTLNTYAMWGTQCHNTIELFMNANDEAGKMMLCDVTNNLPSESFNAYSSFLLWYNELVTNNNVVIDRHESAISCPYFGGTLDGLYIINGKYYLIDYKTSSQVTFKHFLQLAAYRYILYTEYNIDISGCIILQLSKHNIAYHEYFLNLDRADHRQYINECEETFLSIVYSYYNILNLENKFENIEWSSKI